MKHDNAGIDDDYFSAVGRLDWAIRSARARVLDNDALLAHLKGINDDLDSRFTCEAIESRIAQGDREFTTALKDTMLELASETAKGNRLNWSIYRLIVHLGAEGRELADFLLPSSRRVRRLAAYRYYFMQDEVTEVARQLLPQHYLDGERNGLLIRVLAIDNSILQSVGVARVLEIAPGTFWRMRVLQSVISEGDSQDIENLSRLYPEEYLWAVERLRERLHLERVREVLAAHENDPRVIRRGLFCLAALGSPEDLQRTSSAAERLLDGLLAF